MRLLAVPLAVALLTACGGDDDEPATSASVGDELGCDTLEPAVSEELGVRERFICERGAETTNVYTFNSSSARDSWRGAAEEFGTVVLAEGDTWLEVK